MSRTGKKPITVPDKVKVKVADGKLFVEGPLGKTELPMETLVDVKVDPKQVVVTRKEETRDGRRIHGLMRALLQNAITGVSEGFKKNLDIEGIGYRAEVKGNILNMTLGFSHPIEYHIPAGIKIAVDKQTKITVSGSDRKLVGQTAANIRDFRPPEPYKGKGIRYQDEYIQRKVGKAAAAGGK